MMTQTNRPTKPNEEKKMTCSASLNEATRQKGQSAKTKEGKRKQGKKEGKGEGRFEHYSRATLSTRTSNPILAEGVIG